MLKTFYLMCFTTLSLFAGIKPGFYHLDGKNPGNHSGYGYNGTVYIYPQGDNYGLFWCFDGEIAQTGIGILTDNILSVSFVNYTPKEDLSESVLDEIPWCDGGVVSYQVVSETELRGAWTMHLEDEQGIEKLTWFAE